MKRILFLHGIGLLALAGCSSPSEWEQIAFDHLSGIYSIESIDKCDFKTMSPGNDTTEVSCTCTIKFNGTVFGTIQIEEASKKVIDDNLETRFDASDYFDK